MQSSFVLPSILFRISARRAGGRRNITTTPYFIFSNFLKESDVL